MADQDPSILVIGSQKVGKQTLISALQGHLLVQDLPQCLIETKYYSATVQFAKQNVNEQLENIKCEALIFAVDATQTASFQDIVKLPSDNIPDCEIRLLVVNKIDLLYNRDYNRLDRPEWLTSVMSWCADNMFEYIELCASDEKLSEEVLGESLDNETQGLARVLEALKAHMWPNLVLKTVSNHSENNANGSETTAQPNGHSTYETRGTESPSEQAGPQEEYQNSQSDSALEEFNESFEKIVFEMRGERDRIAKLEGEERHEAAAALALQFSALLGLDSDGADDSD